LAKKTKRKYYYNFFRETTAACREEKTKKSQHNISRPPFKEKSIPDFLYLILDGS
jgi:hypothetical protein